LSPAPTGVTEAVGSVMAWSQPKHNHAVSHPHIRRQASSSRHYVGGYALVPRPSSQVSPPVAVTVTATPSGSSGIELEHMEHAVDPSRCATNVPQGHCSGAVPPDHDGGPKPLTCANTAWRHRARTDDLRIQNEQTACPLTMWHKMCHMARLRDGSVGHESRS
jgi:hypothetical protein